MFLLDIFIVHYHNFFAEQTAKVWDDDTELMWWETPRTIEKRTLSIPEKSYRHREQELITIHFNYLLLSKLRHFTHREK
jgi:hypothetical protein